MIVKLTPEQERLVEEELRVGRYRTAEEVIAGALEALRHAAYASDKREQRPRPSGRPCRT
jgi:Arc/MetJ-type ribon-helix-helix transcriptional regulator